MKLRDSFPKTKEEAKSFEVEFKDEFTLFKIFETTDSIETTVLEVNLFLLKNGYEEINLFNFIEDEFNYDSSDELVSLSPHGYMEALVLFIEKG